MTEHETQREECKKDINRLSKRIEEQETHYHELIKPEGALDKMKCSSKQSLSRVYETMRTKVPYIFFIPMIGVLVLVAGLGLQFAYSQGKELSKDHENFAKKEDLKVVADIQRSVVSTLSAIETTVKNLEKQRTEDKQDILNAIKDIKK